MRYLYTAVFYLAIPLIVVRLWWRGRKAPDYRRRWAERFGKVSLPGLRQNIVWLHTVSVGETIAAAPLVARLQKDHPQHTLLVTTTTPTGSARVKAMFGDSVLHCYAPYDLPHCLRRFFNYIQPHCLFIMETELWPNTIAACHKRGIPVALVNARLSEKSARGYARVGALTKPMLRQLSMVAAQHEDDGDRFLQLGLPRERLQITGNIKFDLTLTEEIQSKAQQLRLRINKYNKHIVWIAASTHRGEDEIVLDAFNEARRNQPNVFLILVPRHPERFDEVAKLCDEKGFTVQRRSESSSVPEHSDILLGDTMGELLLLYGAADFCFVGGSLIPVGGHNLMEPAAWGLPIVCGKHLFNFAEASRLLLAAGGMLAVDNTAQLSSAVCNLTQDRELRGIMGERARAVAEANRGALERLTQLLRPYLSKSPRRT